MDYIISLKAKALLAIMDPDNEAAFRKIFREYSREFHTPLHEVADLPLEDVLTAYFESKFEDMDPSLLHNELVAITTSEEEQAEIDQDDDAFFKAAAEDVRKEVEKISRSSPPPPPPVVEDHDEIHMIFDDNLPEEKTDLLKQLLEGDPTRAPPPGKKK